MTERWPGQPRARWRTVRVRITALAVVLVGAGLGLGAWALVARVQAQLEDGVIAAGRRRLELVSDQIRLGVTPEQALAGLPATDPGTLVAASTGEVVASSRSSPDVIFTVWDENAVPVGPGGFVSRVVDSPAGPLTIVSETPLAEVRRSVTALSQTLWIAIPLAVLVVGGLAWVLTGRALRPVDRIRREVDEITHTTLHRRVPDPGTSDEVGRLARTMNAMLDRLERAQDQQRQFVSDASHELRCPLSTIRASVEIAARHPDEHRWGQTATTVLAETDRLDGLVGDLLELARLDEANGTARDRVDVDLDEIVLAEAARITATGPAVDTSSVSAARVQGDSAQLTRLVRNLLDNARRHCTERVAVSVAAEANEAVLRVDDDGTGIAAADRDLVFERFVRLDEGRARAAGGAGLGLALVRAVTVAHRGTVTVEDAPSGGARFEVHLPLVV